MGIKRVKRKSLGKAHGAAAASSTEQSPHRPRMVEKTPPCQVGCPQGTDIRGILTTIAGGEKAGRDREETFKEVFFRLVEKNPLPATCGRVCPHPCEAACNRNSVDEPAAINNVERFVGDWGLERGFPLQRLSEGSHDEKVAVIGSGPAGLACAYHLIRRGYPVTVYEAFPKPGGMLRYGIPAYRLPRKVLDGEIQRIVDLGVDLEVNTAVGRDIALAEVRDKFKAVFVGIGAHKGRLLGCPGEDATNVWTGTEYLNRVNRGERVEVGEKVLVIGGGDTAIDAARVARRMGADVTIVYRRTRAEMPAIEEEIAGAAEEGVGLRFLAAPIELEKDNDRAVSMRCQVMELGEPDGSGRRRPVPVKDREFTLECDTVIAAISQEPDFTGLDALHEGPDWIKAADDGSTAEEMVFAGGDDRELGLVTIALAQGRIAAETIHRRLRGIAPSEDGPEQTVIKSDKMALAFYEKLLRHECEQRSSDSRLASPESEISNGLSEDDAVAEALRCMSCGSCFDCGTCWSYCQDNAIIKPLEGGAPYRLKLEFCKGCAKCAEQCPCGFIEMYDPASAIA